RGNHLAWFDSRDTVAEPFHHTNQIPPRREGQRWRLGMNALALHHVGQGDAGGQHAHPYLAVLRLGALLFNYPKFLGPTVVGDDDARVSQGRILSLPSPCERGDLGERQQTSGFASAHRSLPTLRLDVQSVEARVDLLW